MNRIAAILILLILVSCNNNKNNRPASSGPIYDMPPEVATPKTRKKAEPIIPLRDPYNNLYLTDLTYREIGELLLIDSVIPMDNTVTFKLLDTISSCSETDIAFFLQVFDNIMEKSDGALAEVVGSYTWGFIEKRPSIFVKHLDTLDQNIVEDWANFTIYEMSFAYPIDSLGYECQQLISKLKQISTNPGLVHFEKALIENVKERQENKY